MAEPNLFEILIDDALNTNDYPLIEDLIKQVKHHNNFKLNDSILIKAIQSKNNRFINILIENSINIIDKDLMIIQNIHNFETDTSIKILDIYFKKMDIDKNINYDFNIGIINGLVFKFENKNSIYQFILKYGIVLKKNGEKMMKIFLEELFQITKDLLVQNEFSGFVIIYVTILILLTRLDQEIIIWYKNIFSKIVFNEETLLHLRSFDYAIFYHYSFMDDYQKLSSEEEFKNTDSKVLERCKLLTQNKDILNFIDSFDPFKLLKKAVESNNTFDVLNIIMSKSAEKINRVDLSILTRACLNVEIKQILSSFYDQLFVAKNDQISKSHSLIKDIMGSNLVVDSKEHYNVDKNDPNHKWFKYFDLCESLGLGEMSPDEVRKMINNEPITSYLDNNITSDDLYYLSSHLIYDIMHEHDSNYLIPVVLHFSDLDIKKFFADALEEISKDIKRLEKTRDIIINKIY